MVCFFVAGRILKSNLFTQDSGVSKPSNGADYHYDPLEYISGDAAFPAPSTKDVIKQLKLQLKPKNKGSNEVRLFWKQLDPLQVSHEGQRFFWTFLS